MQAGRMLYISLTLIFIGDHRRNQRSTSLDQRLRLFRPDKTHAFFPRVGKRGGTGRLILPRIGIHLCQSVQLVEDPEQFGGGETSLLFFSGV